MKLSVDVDLGDAFIWLDTFSSMNWLNVLVHNLALFFMQD